MPLERIVLNAKLLVEGSSLFTPAEVLRESTREERRVARRKIVIHALQGLPDTPTVKFTSEQTATFLVLGETGRENAEFSKKAAYIPYVGMRKRSKIQQLVKITNHDRTPVKANKPLHPKLESLRNYLKRSGFDSTVNILIGNPSHTGKTVKEWERMQAIASRETGIGSIESMAIPYNTPLGKAKARAEYAIFLYQTVHVIKDTLLGCGMYFLFTPGRVGSIIMSLACIKIGTQLLSLALQLKGLDSRPPDAPEL